MGQVDDIRKRREGIEAQLKDVQCDMSKIIIIPLMKKRLDKAN